MKKVVILVLFLFSSSLHAADELKIKPFTPESETETYDPENLYEYIDGAADNFLSYGFQLLQVRDFSHENLQFTVEIYNMGENLNAFGIYRSERPQNVPSIAIGAEAVISPPYQALLLKGIYYVKINAFEGELDTLNGKKLLKAVSEVLPGENVLPDQLNLLPAQNKIPNSEGYVKESFLGMSFLNRCLFARYEAADSLNYRVFIMLPDKQETSASLWDKLASNWKSEKFQGISLLWRNIPYKGFAATALKNDLIYGVADCKTKESALKMLAQILK